MKANRAIFFGLLAGLYGLICFVMMASGYSMTDCITLIGWPLGAYLGFNIIMMFGRMILIVSADNAEESTHGGGWSPSLRLPAWMVDWAQRVGGALSVVLDLLPAMRVIVLITTLCAGPLAGVNYLFTTSGPTLVTDLFQLIGQLSGLWVVYALSMAAISAIELADVAEFYAWPRRSSSSPQPSP